MEAGREEAVVAMASGDNATKPSRRCPWHRELLLHLFSATELTELLHRATETIQTGWLRHRALRWLCPAVTQDEALDTWLKRFAEEPDPLVKFWAAFRLSTIGWIPCSPPPPAPRWVLRALRHGFFHPVLMDDYSNEDEQQRAIAVCALDHLGLDAMKETAAWLEIQPKHDAYVWWHLLGFIRLQRLELLESMRDHWKAILPAASHEALHRFLMLLDATRKASDLLDYTQHPDAPQPSELGGSAVRFPLYSDAFALQHALQEPKSSRRFHKKLIAELQRQDMHSATKRTRLDRAWALLKEHTPAEDENLAAVNAAIPFAIADHLLNSVDPPTLPSYEFSYRTMTS